MAKSTSKSQPKEQPYYPVEIRAEDMQISRAGELLIVGRPAEIVRRLVLNYPEFYPKSIVPYLQSREASFQPEELWIDPKRRVHITNKKLVARARHHMAAAKKATAAKTAEPAKTAKATKATTTTAKAAKAAKSAKKTATAKTSPATKVTKAAKAKKAAKTTKAKK
ncbi:MAG: hypothetical protein GC160_20345 [Acidobacteria bacterium]|nr:hypothetical protein [Acidobacteriota bacterium]